MVFLGHILPAGRSVHLVVDVAHIVAFCAARNCSLLCLGPDPIEMEFVVLRARGSALRDSVDWSIEPQ